MTNMKADLTRQPDEQVRHLIEDTMYRYNRSIDTGDKDEFLSVFTTNGVKSSPTYWGDLVGHEELTTWFDKFYGGPDFKRFQGGQHRIANLIYNSVETDEIRTWCNFTLVVPGERAPYISVIGNYHDTFVPVGDRWLFKRRSIEIVKDCEK